MHVSGIEIFSFKVDIPVFQAIHVPSSVLPAWIYFISAQ